jgi:hypothetical protein
LLDSPEIHQPRTSCAAAAVMTRPGSVKRARERNHFQELAPLPFRATDRPCGDPPALPEAPARFDVVPHCRTCVRLLMPLIPYGFERGGDAP